MTSTTLTCFTLLLLGAVAAPVGASALTNLALSSDGASFVTASSANAAAGSGANLTTMQGNIITSSPSPWFNGHEKRYIFAKGDLDQWVEIKLGSLSAISSIGAKIDLPGTDRAVVGPFTVETSVNGTSWTDWGSPLTIDTLTTNPTTITDTTRDVLYIKYFFGPSGPQYHSGGSGIHQVFADGVAISAPEPAAWALMLVGFAALGGALRAARARRTESRALPT